MQTIKYGDTGVMVELLQSILKKIGYYRDEIDGIYKEKSEDAVKEFQRDFLLTPDGVVGPDTWGRLSPYINGFTNYTIKKGDTIYGIAREFNTDVNRILTANPEINSNNLYIGQKIIVPFLDIVPTNINYSYEILNLNVPALKRVYPFLEIENVGRSVLGKVIPSVRFGNGNKQVFYSGAIHANEWITAPLLMKFAENISRAYTKDGKIYGRNAKDIFNETSIYIIPMCNPDGVDLVTRAIKQGTAEYDKALAIARNYPSIPFTDGWKANINGVDLNLQFPAGWEQAKEIKYEIGYTSPAPRDFVGFGPLSEPEALALYNFTKKHDFNLILAYHTQGEVIYWRYLDYEPENAREIGEKFSRISGYTLESTPYASGFAGYKDWFIQEYNRPGYTIEVGLGDNPIPISQFNKIYSQNEGILVEATLV